MKLIPLKTLSLFFRRITLLVLYCICPFTYAQKISMEIVEIEDSRVKSRITQSESAILIVRTEVKGLETGPHRFLKPGKITRAIDNLGNTIQADEPTYREYNSFGVVDFRLFSAERKASEISVLEGTVKYFNPTTANNGLINVDKPADKLGTNILKGKYSDIVIVLLDRKKLQKLKNENEKAYKQQLDNLKKEYGPYADSIDELDEVLDDSGFGNDSELFFFLSDPDSQILSLSVVDADGQNLVYGSSMRGNHMSYPLSSEAPLSNNMKIELTVENPQAVKEYPFKLEKIKLP